MKKLLLVLILSSFAFPQYQPDSIKILCNQKNILVGTQYSGYWLQHYGEKRYKAYSDFANVNFDVYNISRSWAQLCPKTRGIYDWALLDSMMFLADSLNKTIIYTAIFQNADAHIPNWVKAGGYSEQQLIEIVQEFTTDLVSRYRGYGQKIYYQVVNEICVSSTILTTGWLNTHCPHYWRYAFEAAHFADPDAELGYNDDMNIFADGNSSRGNAYIKVLDSLVADGSSAYITYLGLQTHLQLDTNGVYRYAQVAEQLNRIRSKINVPIIISELDFRIPNTIADSSINMHRQAKSYAAIVKQITDLNIPILCFWGWTDEDSWIPDNFAGWDYPCLYSKYDAAINAFIKKRAYYSVVDALRDSTKKSIGNVIKVKINNTAIADSQSVFCHSINLHNLPPKLRTMFFAKINTNRDNVIVTDTAGNVLQSYISGIDKTKQIAILNVNYTVYPDKQDQYILIKYGDNILTGVNNRSIFADAGIVADIDFSTMSGGLKNKASTVKLDSIYTPSGLTIDTCKYGWRLKSNGKSYICNKSSDAGLNITSGTMSAMWFADSLDAVYPMYAASIADLSGLNAAGYRIIPPPSKTGISRLRIGGIVTDLPDPSRPSFDSLWNFTFLSFGNNLINSLTSARASKQKNYQGQFNISGVNKLNIFVDYNRQVGTRWKGSIAYLRVYNTAKSNEFRSTEYNMIRDNQNFYQYKE